MLKTFRLSILRAAIILAGLAAAPAFAQAQSSNDVAGDPCAVVVTITGGKAVKANCSVGVDPATGAATSNSSDATAANQTATQAVAGSDAAKAQAVQGITGGKAVAVSGTVAVTGVATSAKQDSLLTALGSPAQAGVAGYGNVVSSDASYTAGTDQKLTLTATGRLKVGLSSATNIAPGALAAGTTGANLEACIFRSGAITMTDQQTAAVSCIADGSLRVNDIVIGTTADAAYAGSGSASAISVLKGIYTGMVAATPAGANVIGGVTQSGTWVVGGSVASGNTGGNNPFGIAATYGTSLPTFTNGQRGDLQIEPNGSLRSLMTGASAAPVATATNVILPVSTSAITSASSRQPLGVLCYSWNGTNLIPCPGDATGLYSVPTPTSAATNTVAITGSSTAVEGSRVVCAAACNAYGFQVNSGALGGWILMFNATSAPADGAVTPVKFWQVGANSTATADLSYGGIPLRMATGWTLVFSTTGPFTKTISATATFSAESK